MNAIDVSKANKKEIANQEALQPGLDISFYVCGFEIVADC